MRQIIESFINSKDIAIAGVSTDSTKWGSVLYRELTKKGYNVYPINPQIDEIDGAMCYRSVANLPDHVENLILATPPSATECIVKECKETGIKRIWMHRGGGGTGAQSDAAIKFVRENNMELVYGLCPMMFLHGGGIHRFHLWLKKISGKLPVEYSVQ